MRGAQRVREFQTILKMLTTDSQFLAFHEGRSDVLPEFYHREYERNLGPYAALLSLNDRTPVMVSGHREPAEPEPVGGPAPWRATMLILSPVQLLPRAGDAARPDAYSGLNL